jgi:sodium/hydrogen antiporter
MLLNLSIFIWFGAVCPWESFATNSVVSMCSLVLLGILILLLRRLPILLALRKYIHQIDGIQQAVFMGFFGPIGVSAIFYLYISLEFLETITVDGVQRDDARKLGEVLTVVIWFLAICSNVS